MTEYFTRSTYVNMYHADSPDVVIHAHYLSKSSLVVPSWKCGVGGGVKITASEWGENCVADDRLSGRHRASYNRKIERLPLKSVRAIIVQGI